MILLRQRTYSKLHPVAQRVKNFWYKTGVRFQPILKKSDYRLKESAERMGERVNKIITRPLAVGSNVMVDFASRPLETAGMPLLVAPELVSTAIGGGMIAAGKGLRKIKPIGRASDNFAKYLRNTKFYKRAQNSTRGFHNDFGMSKPTLYAGLGAVGVGTGTLIGRKINRDRKKRYQNNIKPQ